MASKKFWHILTDNIGYKIAALFLAIILWLVVYNIDDPNKTKMYSISVEITNNSYMEEKNLCYEVLDNTDTVTFAINTARSNLDDLSDKDFEAVADLSDMEISEDGTEGLVPIEITATRHASEIKFTNTTKYLRVSLEELYTEKFAVKARATGDVADGFALASVTAVNPTMITVEGPASVVQRISTVVAAIDVSNITMDYTCDVKPTYYDEDGNEVDVSRIISFSSDKVTVSAKVLATKTVPLNFSTTGTPADGYELTEVTSDPNSITIKGDSETLGGITSIDLPDTLLNIQGATGNITSNIDISQYLPDGVSLLKSSEATVAVTVGITSDITKSYTVPTTNLTLKGLDESKYTATIKQESITVQVTGSQTDLANISDNSIIGTVDVSKLGVGNNTVNVEFGLNSTLYKTSTVSVTVVIQEISSTDEDSSAEEN